MFINVTCSPKLFLYLACHSGLGILVPHEIHARPEIIRVSKDSRAQEARKQECNKARKQENSVEAEDGSASAHHIHPSKCGSGEGRYEG